MKQRKKCYESGQIYGTGTIGTELKNKRINHETHETEENAMTADRYIRNWQCRNGINEQENRSRDA
jgi:hypothetical protein